MEFTELRFWINKTRFAVRIPRVRVGQLKMRNKQKSYEHVDHLTIPSEWQNTLTKKYSTLKRSSSSVPSFASSTSSSYSVSEFLQDLETTKKPDNPSLNVGIDIFAPHVDKTSTPFSSHILPLNRMRGRKSKQVVVHDVSGVKIYEDDDEKEDTKHSDNIVYENTQFLKRHIVTNDDTEDGYEIVVLRNRVF